MRLSEFMKTLSANETIVVTRDGKPLRAYYEADDSEGWIDVPDLSTLPPVRECASPWQKDQLQPNEHLSFIGLKAKRLTGQVAFHKVPPAERPPLKPTK